MCLETPVAKIMKCSIYLFVECLILSSFVFLFESKSERSFKIICERTDINGHLLCFSLNAKIVCEKTVIKGHEN